MSGAIEAGGHELDPEFARHLEWQVRTELRRKERFGELDAPPRAAGRIARVLAVAVVALALGAGSVVAAQGWKRSREAELLGAGVQVELSIASLRAENARAECADLERGVDAGFATADELADCEQRALAAQLELARLECDADEIAGGGREPSDRVSAPLVAGRDFVHERLELALAVAARARKLAERHVERAEALHERGVLADSELAARRAEARASLLELERLDRVLEVRARFVAGQLDAARAELEALRIAGESSLHAAAAAVERAEVEAARVAALAERGFVSESERRRAETARAQARAAAALAELELELVGEREKR